MLEVKTFPKDMSVFEVDRKEPRRCLLSGVFEEPVDVNGISRKFYSFLKPGLCYNQPCLVVAAPGGISGPEFLENSAFMQFADEHDLFLFVAVSEGEHWKLDGSDADYFNKVYLQINSRRSYVTMQDNIYAVGVGEGATVAQQAVMKMSTEWSGLATFGDLADSVLLNAEAIHGAENTGNTELSVNAKKVQVPVWMTYSASEGNNAACRDYWMGMNDVDEECFSNADADEIYFPSKVIKKSQVNEEKIAQVRVTIAENAEPDLARMNAVWKYIGLACRHRGFGTKHLRYRIEPEKYGFTYHTLEHNGFTHRWYEYVPAKVKESGDAAPLVICMHGRGGTAETFISLSGMSRVAEERDFIVVFPEAGVSQQRPTSYKNLLLWEGKFEGQPTDDFGFIMKMLADVKARNKIDETRIYACGQSSGGMMTTSLALKAPRVFAAAAPWSALVDPDGPMAFPEKIDPQIPLFFLFGDKDFLCAGGENGQLEYQVTEQIAGFLTNVMDAYGLEKVPATYRVGEITYYVYRNAKGTPMLTVGKVKDMPHANYPRESWISYDEFLSKFRREADGTLLYMGRPAY